jgi:hypothetical protein
MADSGYGNQDNHPGALDVDVVDWILGGGKSGNTTRLKITVQNVELHDESNDSMSPTYLESQPTRQLTS